MTAGIPVPGEEQEYAGAQRLREQDGLETWECWGRSGHHLVKIHPGEPRAFLEEFRFLQSFEHPSLPKVHSYRGKKGKSYYIREFVSGKPLSEFFGRLDSEELAVLAINLARSLAALHFRGYVHGDLHAENVIYDSGTRSVFLIDFEFLSPKHQSPGVIRGFPQIMAPELFWGAAPTIQTDLYALGCVLYALIGGHYPFSAREISSLIHQHAFEMPPDPTTLRHGFPRSLGLLALRLLAKEPGFRMASANDVVREINGIFNFKEALEVPPAKTSSWQRLQVAKSFSWQDQAIKFLSGLENPEPDQRKMLAELYLKTGKLEALEKILKDLPGEEAWLYKGLLLNRKGHYDQALQHLLINKPLENTQAILALATAFYYTGHSQEAFDTLEQSEVILKGSPRGRALLANHQGNLYFFGGNFSEAEQAFSQAISEARDAGEVFLEALALMNLANVQQGLFFWAMAYENYERALELFRGLGQPIDQIKVQLNLAGLCRFLGHLEKSEDLIDRSMRMLRDHPNPQLSAYGFLLQADLEKKLGNFRPAMFNLQDAEGCLRENPSAVDRGDLLSSQAEILFALEDQESLIELLGQMHAYALQVKDRLLEQRQDFLKKAIEGIRIESLDGKALRLLGETLMQQGDSEFILDNLQIAKGLAEKKNIPWPQDLQDWAEEKIRQIASQIPEDYRLFFLKLYTELSGRASMHPHFQNYPSTDGVVSDPALDQILGWVRELTGETKVPDLTRKILHRLMDFTEMERGFVILKSGKQLIVAHSHLMAPEETSGETGLSWSLTQKAMEQGEVLFTADAPNDSRLVGARSIGNLNLKAILVLPFKCEGNILGAVYLDSKLTAQHLQKRDLPYLKGLADLIGVALRNATKMEKTQQVLEQTRRELQRSKKDLQTKYQYNQIIGKSSAMRELLQKIDRVTDVQVPVLLLGESGVGKELFAKAIHFNGPLKEGPWIAANCSAIPENLVESEFFGHERGAFTGALNAREGLFEQANNGTLFLDEIGDMPLALQAKLLRVLQEQEVRRLGGRAPKSVKVRVIAATHRNLKAEIKAGRFREDLYYRLSVAEISIPPLRERVEDIPFLAHHFLKKFANENSVSPHRLDSKCLPVLQSHPWNGNVRELENLIYHLCIFSSGDKIDLDTLAQKPEFQGLIKRMEQGDLSIQEPLEELSSAIDRGEMNLSEAKRRFEREEIVRVLGMMQGKVGEAAKHLGIPRPQLSRLLKYHGLRSHGN